MSKLFENNVTGKIGIQKYLCEIKWRNGVLIMDEPAEIGGKDLGPDPYTTLLASLAGCTLSTLRMYIDRKGWDVPEISISMNIATSTESGFSTIIFREIKLPDDLTEDQKQRLLVIAGKCPVSKILQNSITIKTTT
ncbi:MAG: OsmC family protein [Saprospiraceae bacterium]|nr:OsmC family protein [Saprospiraceae bacterium]